MAQEQQATFTRDEQVEVYLGGIWVPALIKGVNNAFTSSSAGLGYTYTVTPDLAGQPQFTNRPPVHYPTLKGVSAKSLRARGSSDDPSDKVDALAPIPSKGVTGVGDFAHFNNLDRHNSAAAEALGYDSTKPENPSGEMPVSVPAGSSANIKSDSEGNVTHGANASVELVGDVTGTNATGSVNAAGHVPAAAPNTPVNQTPYTVEASADPALNLDRVNRPNTGVAPAVNEDARTDAEPGKTGNPAPVNSNEAKDKLVAGDEQDGATASSIPVGSKDDHQANEDANDKNLSDEQKASAVENPVVPEVKDKLASGDLETRGTNSGFDVGAAEERAKNAEKMTSDTDPTKPTQEDADKVADLQSATGDRNPQRPATDTAATDGTVNPDRSVPGTQASSGSSTGAKAGEPQTVEEATQQGGSSSSNSGAAATGNNSQSGREDTPQAPKSNPANK